MKPQKTKLKTVLSAVLRILGVLLAGYIILWIPDIFDFWSFPYGMLVPVMLIVIPLFFVWLFIRKLPKKIKYIYMASYIPVLLCVICCLPDYYDFIVAIVPFLYILIAAILPTITNSFLKHPGRCGKEG